MCLPYAATRNVYLVQGLGLSSTLCWDMDCLLCAVTLSDKEDNVSTLWLHTDCLLSDGICLYYDGIVSSLWCHPDLSTLWRLVSTLWMASDNIFINLVAKRNKMEEVPYRKVYLSPHQGWSKTWFWETFCDSRSHLVLRSTKTNKIYATSNPPWANLPTFVFYSPSFLVLLVIYLKSFSRPQCCVSIC